LSVLLLLCFLVLYLVFIISKETLLFFIAPYLNPVMTYEISKQIRIYNNEDEWDYVFTTDEYGTVTVAYRENLREMPNCQTIHIPKDCIQHFIDALSELK